MDTSSIIINTVTEILNFGHQLNWNGKALYVNDKTKNELLKASWNRLYVRFRPEHVVVFSNIYLIEEIQGCGIFTQIVELLQANNYGVVVECPEPRLQDWCERNGVAWYR